MKTIPELTTELEQALTMLAQEYERATGLRVWTVFTNGAYVQTTKVTISIRVDERPKED